MGEKGPATATDCSPRQRANQAIVSWFYSGRCAKGDDDYVKGSRLCTIKCVALLGCSSHLSLLLLLPCQPQLLKMVILVSSDNEQFVVDKDVAERSVLIKNMLEGEYTATPRSPVVSCLNQLVHP